MRAVAEGDPVSLSVGEPPSAMSAEVRSPRLGCGSAPVVALVDRRELTRHCLKRWLEEAWPGHRVLAASAVREIGIQLRQAGTLRFAVMGVPAGAASAPETLAGGAQLCRLLTGSPVVVVAESEDVADVAAVIRAGARGCVPTSLDRSAAVEAIRFVLAGGTFVPAGVLAGEHTAAAEGAVAEPDPGPTATAGRQGRLSPRELEVAACLRRGRPNKVIARELAISESTVKVLVGRILAKLGAANRTHAALLLEHRINDTGTVAL